MNNPLVSIIILNYNNINDTIECLDSLKSTTYPSYEIIVVDNGSTDTSVQALGKRTDIKLIEKHKNYGFTGGCNIGIKEAKGELICLLNNDTVVDTAWLDELVKTLLSDEKMGATYAFFIDYGTPKEKTWPTPQHLHTLKNATHNLMGYIINNVFDDYITTHLTASGCCLLFKKSILDSYFDEDYFIYYEDMYFCWRLRLQGYQIQRSPYAVVYHKCSRTVKINKIETKARYLSERNRIMTLFIFYETKTLIKLVPLFLADGIKKIALIIIRLFYNPGYSLAILSAWCWLLFNIINIYRKRKTIQLQRKIYDADIIPGFCYKIINSSNPLINFLNWPVFCYVKLAGLKTYEIAKRCK